MLSIWAMPGPSSGCFVMTKSVRQHKIVKGGKLQKSESPFICVIIAEGSTNALPVSTSILAHFCIPVSLHNKNVILRCLINDILWLVIEFFCFVVIIVWRWGVYLYYYNVERDCSQADGDEPAWRLGDIPWQCSWCPCEQEIQHHARVYPLFHWRKNCALPLLLLFYQSSSILFHRVQGCSISTCPFCVLVPGVSL